MSHAVANKTDRVMGVFTLLSGLCFGIGLCIPVRLIIQYYRPQLDMLLMAMGTGLGLVSAVGMIPVGLLVMNRHRWAQQGVQLILMGWVFANGFAMLAASLFSFRPINAVLLCGSVWPLILWIWARSLAEQSVGLTPADDMSAKCPPKAASGSRRGRSSRSRAIEPDR